MLYGLAKLQYLSIRPASVSDAGKLYFSFPIVFIANALRRPLLPSWAIRVRTEDSVLAIRPGVANLAIVCSTFEPKTRSWFNIKPGETFLDVGANVGYYTVKALRAGARVVAVEPDPSNYELLRLNAPEANAVNVALGSADGTASLYLNRDSSLSSMVPRPGTRRMDVKLMTIDSLTQVEGVDRFDWVKIDAEFHEKEILEGGHEALSKTKNLIVEVATGNMESVKRILGGMGLTVKDLEFMGDSANLFATRN